MSDPTNRRRFLKFALYGLIAGGAVRHLPVAQAEEAAQLDPEDPQAKALGYVHESPDAEKNCANCMHIQAEEGEWRPCALFPGKTVNEAGYCNVWVAKPA